jgi:hypothetical protein
MDFQGYLFDIFSEVVIERSPVIRGTYAEAMEDAKGLVAVMNDAAEAIDDSTDENTTVGRVDESYCFVLMDGAIVYSEEEFA